MESMDVDVPQNRVLRVPSINDHGFTPSSTPDPMSFFRVPSISDSHFHVAGAAGSSYPAAEVPSMSFSPPNTSNFQFAMVTDESFTATNPQNIIPINPTQAPWNQRFQLTNHLLAQLGSSPPTRSRVPSISDSTPFFHDDIDL
eukprot:GILJ01000667.1.p1 GENE.GILJ01000667.1~~GILJ01000667.1.p1  ORF type:complete len:143 (-),score=9.80 GILJ01000667.1:374-802(-)